MFGTFVQVSDNVGPAYMNFITELNEPAWMSSSAYSIADVVIDVRIPWCGVIELL